MTETLVVKHCWSRVAAILGNLEQFQDRYRTHLPPEWESGIALHYSALQVLTQGKKGDAVAAEDQQGLCREMNAMRLQCKAQMEAFDAQLKVLPPDDFNTRTIVGQMRKKLVPIHNQADALLHDAGSKDASSENNRLIMLGETLGSAHSRELNLLRYLLVDAFCEELADDLKRPRKKTIPIAKEQVLRYGSGTMPEQAVYPFDAFRLPHDVDLGIIGARPAEAFAAFCRKFAEARQGNAVTCGLGAEAISAKQFAPHQFCCRMQMQHNTIAFTLTPGRMRKLVRRALQKCEEGKLLLNQGDISLLQDFLDQDRFSAAFIRSTNLAYKTACEEHKQLGLWDKSVQVTRYGIPIFLNVDCRMDIPPPLVGQRAENGSLPRLNPVLEFVNKFLYVLESKKLDTKVAGALLDMQVRHDKLQRELGLADDKLRDVARALIVLSIPLRPEFQAADTPEQYFPRIGIIRKEGVMVGHSGHAVYDGDYEAVVQAMNRAAPGLYRDQYSTLGRVWGEDIKRARALFHRYENSMHSPEYATYEDPKQFDAYKAYLGACHHKDASVPLDRAVVAKIVKPALGALKKYGALGDGEMNDDDIVDALCARLEQGIAYAQMIAPRPGERSVGLPNLDARVRRL